MASKNLSFCDHVHADEMFSLRIQKILEHSPVPQNFNEIKLRHVCGIFASLIIIIELFFFIFLVIYETQHAPNRAVSVHSRRFLIRRLFWGLIQMGLKLFFFANLNSLFVKYIHVLCFRCHSIAMV